MLPLILIAFLLILLAAGGASAMTKGIALNEEVINDLCRRWAAMRGNLLPQEIKAIMYIESSFVPTAENPADPSSGLMQVTPLILKAYAGTDNLEDGKDPETNTKAGSGFLSDLKAKYQLRFPDYQWVQMYNTGETSFLKKGLRVPEYEAKFKKALERFEGDFE